MNPKSGKHWTNISSHSQTTCIWFANMNHMEKPVHIAHEHALVFSQETNMFWFVMSCLLTVCVWFANHIYIYKHLVCEPYAVVWLASVYQPQYVLIIFIFLNEYTQNADKFSLQKKFHFYCVVISTHIFLGNLLEILINYLEIELNCTNN